MCRLAHLVSFKKDAGAVQHLHLSKNNVKTLKRFNVISNN